MQSAPSISQAPSELLVVSFDPDTGDAAPNDEWIELVGPADDPFRHLSAEDENLARELVQKARSGRMTTGQVLFVADGPRQRTVLLHFMPVHLSDREEGLPVLITGELLELSESVNPAQTEQARMANLGQMTMGVAHNFNNLLSGIMGHTELMRAALSRDLDRELLSEHVASIEQAASDGNHMIKKLQRHLRQEEKTAHVPLDLSGLIQDCVVFTRPYWYNEPRIQGRAIMVEQDLDSVPAILGSASDIRDVLVNLILNAVQAMPQGGIITVRTRLVQGRVRLSVADTGTGMSADVLAQVFDLGYTTKQEGNGVGLAVARGGSREDPRPQGRYSGRKRSRRRHHVYAGSAS